VTEFSFSSSESCNAKFLSFHCYSQWVVFRSVSAIAFPCSKSSSIGKYLQFIPKYSCSSRPAVCQLTNIFSGLCCCQYKCALLTYSKNLSCDKKNPLYVYRLDTVVSYNFFLVQQMMNLVGSRQVNVMFT
jgi:hypothetical protein